MTLTTKKRLDRNYAQRRTLWEPIYEVMQMTGEGEAPPAPSPTSAPCSFFPDPYFLYAVNDTLSSSSLFQCLTGVKGESSSTVTLTGDTQCFVVNTHHGDFRVHHNRHPEP